MKLNKKITMLKRNIQKDDNFVNASPKERLLFIWDLTAELWSLKGSKYVKQRLQRNITNIIRK